MKGCRAMHARLRPVSFVLEAKCFPYGIAIQAKLWYTVIGNNVNCCPATIFLCPTGKGGSIMKRICFLTLLLAVLIICTCALADTYYVFTPNGKTLNLRSPANNAVIGNIPYGTKLETDSNLSTETAAYVTWGGKSGYVKWQFLVKDPPPSKSGSTVKASPAKTTVKTVPGAMLPTDGDGDITIQAYGAYIEYTSKKNSGQYSAVSFDSPVKVKVTASLPKGKTIDYWVIDGVRYDFNRVPTYFTLDNVTDSIIVEAVAKGQSSQTLLSAEAIQSIRTGEILIVQTIHAKLCHVRKDLKGAGGWIKMFDFTDNYVNRATNRTEIGGQVTIRVKAIIPSGKKISYWKFDDMKIDFNKNVTEMLIHTLNVSKTYQPVFTKTTTTTQTRTPAEPPTLLAPGVSR